MPSRPRDAAKMKGYTVPKEIIQHGKPYYLVVHHETEEHGRFTVDHSFNGLTLDDGTDPNKPEGDEVHLTREPNLEVHWSRPSDLAPVAMGEDEEGIVQVMLHLHRDALLEWADRVREDELIHASSAISGKLTRHQLNKLIKVLRKARDQAFGTDE